MRGLIWYSYQKDIGLKQFKRICDGYKRLNIACNRSYENSVQIFAEFENGDVWQVVPATDTSRGHACNVAYIDRSIPKITIDTIIMPCIKAPPYRAYNYY